MIVQALYRKQQQKGHLSKETLREVAQELDVPLHRIQSIVTFFPHFRTEPPPRIRVGVCRDMTCHLKGSLELLAELSQFSQETFGSAVDCCAVSCLGRCDRAPAAMINDELFVDRTAVDLQSVVVDFYHGRDIMPDSDESYARSRSSRWDIDIYNGDSDYSLVKKYLDPNNPLLEEYEQTQSDGGSESLREADDIRLRASDPAAYAVIMMLKQAGLLGMGGAGGRTYKKWSDVFNAISSEKYVVCNADESEPGTFKDRDLLLLAPYLIIEGMIVAGLVTGARRGWIYIRHEYQEQVQAIERELSRAHAIGALGRDIFQSGRQFELEVFVSPGGYICGEQTALIEAMEDRRAEPRNRPPDLQTNGYKDQPTLVNNVETFAWVPAILKKNAGVWFQRSGLGGLSGKRFFSISGDVRKPGAYEVPCGITLGEIIERHAGGMLDDKRLYAVALSGPSGGLLPAKLPVEYLGKRFVERYVPSGASEYDLLQLPLDINVARNFGFMIGAGIVVYGEGTDIVAEALALSRFFREESCGKCVPCRLGSHRITEMGELIRSGQVDERELPELHQIADRLGRTMEGASICGLGTVASNPIRSLLRFFPEAVRTACQVGTEEGS